MGYTHYWVQSRSFTPEEWEAIRTATNAVIASQTGRETLGDDALANDDEIHLNGIGDDQHEPFHITRQLVPLSPQQQSMRDTIKKKTANPVDPFEIELKRMYCGGPDEAPHTYNFCKTAGKPYDAAVTAVLSIVNHYAAAVFAISSDGEAQDWADGIRLASGAIQAPVTNPILSAQ